MIDRQNGARWYNGIGGDIIADCPLFLDWQDCKRWNFIASILDKFELKFAGSASVPFTDKYITWKSDRETKFKNPEDISKFNEFARPPHWSHNITALGDHLQNQDFIVWMRVAAFPTFRKLYRKLDYDAAAKEGPYGSGLPSGKYELTIQYSILFPWYLLIKCYYFAIEITFT